MHDAVDWEIDLELNIDGLEAPRIGSFTTNSMRAAGVAAGSPFEPQGTNSNTAFRYSTIVEAQCERLKASREEESGQRARDSRNTRLR